MLVGNPAAPYSRALRIGRTLAAAGFDVEISAVAGEGVAEREHDGPILIRRYLPSGPLAALAPTGRTSAGATQGAAGASGRRTTVLRRPLPLRLGASLRRWIFWPHTVRGWWATLARELEPAELYHACGSLTIAAALAARERDRHAGRSSRVIYDAIDDVSHSNNMLGVPGPVRAMIRRRERRWARSADARITVNDELSVVLGASWGTPPPVVVPNWPEPRPGPSGRRPDLIRERLGLAPSTRIAIFQGRLGPNLGLDAAAEAILAVPDAVLCLVGFGRGYAASRARDADPRFAGRHVTLPAVHPDEIVAWTASADVALVPLPPVSANQRAATPNKFWEALAAGTPVVLGPGLDVMARLVLADDLGAVAASLRPADLAEAIRIVLDVDPRAALERRRRIAAVARERFSWPRAAERYRTVVRDLVAGPGIEPRGAR